MMGAHAPRDPLAQVTNADAARLLLEKMGVSPAEIVGSTAQCPEVPVFAEYIPRVRAAVGSGTRRVYSSYWDRVLTAWGSRRLDEVTALDISRLAERVKANAVVRKNTRGGRGAAEHLVAALRCVYRHAVADGLISEAENPSIRVAKPRRLPSTRRALPDGRLEELNRVAACTGNDPALDTLLLRLHVETACRRGGALALMPCDLDPEQCLIQLHEKGGTVRWQPVSPTLMAHLLAHGERRGGLETDTRLLRYASGKPVTSRRYDHLWHRLGEHLPWVATQQISTHWLRHTTLTWVERNFGFATAHAYAGHTDNCGRDGSATTTYVRASLAEVATALAALTGEPHPLAMEAVST
jgi:integrase/recombinase XerC